MSVIKNYKDLHIETTYHGEPIIIDVAKIMNVYEVMVMHESGYEIEEQTFSNYEDAKHCFLRFRSKYTGFETVLTGKYAQLRDDLKRAFAVGLEARNSRRNTDGSIEDGGTCNFDSIAVKLPRWIEKRVLQAVKEAGSTAFKGDGFWKSYYIVAPIGSGQGNARSRNAEAASAVLRQLGYTAMTYEEID